jgi:predicted DNA-binding transcriptional regulator AlpA
MTTLDGRRVQTRSELMETYDLGRSTLEKWFRERAQNGHPEPAGKVGTQLAWDAEEWARWYKTRGTKTPGLATRDDLMAKHNLSRHTLKKLWAERATNNHPAPAHQSGKTLYWNESEWSAWYKTHSQATPEESPDDLITLAEAARILGLAQSSTTVYAKRPPAGWPEPAEEIPLAGGRVRRLYRRSDIHTYAAKKQSPP